MSTTFNFYWVVIDVILKIFSWKYNQVILNKVWLVPKNQNLCNKSKKPTVYLYKKIPKYKLEYDNKVNTKNVWIF